jgi:hypothetical protein
MELEEIKENEEISVLPDMDTSNIQIDIMNESSMHYNERQLIIEFARELILTGKSNDIESAIISAATSYRGLKFKGLYRDIGGRVAISFSNPINESKKKLFIDNLEKSCVTFLKSEFEDKDFKVQIQGDIDLDKVNVNINEVQVGVDDSTTIKKIEKVKIGTNKNEGTTESALTNSIKDKLSKELGISKDKIIVYKI